MSRSAMITMRLSYDYNASQVSGCHNAWQACHPTHHQELVGPRLVGPQVPVPPDVEPGRRSLDEYLSL